MKRQQQHQFLSDGRFERTQSLRRSALPLHKKQQPNPPDRKIVNLTLKKTPFGDEPFLAHLDSTEDGLPDFKPGHHKNANCDVELDCKRALDLLTKGHGAVIKAITFRQVKPTRGSPSELLGVANAMKSQSEIQTQMREEIGKMTTLEAPAPVRAPAVELVG